jgi:hypothetical protein
MTEKHWYFDSDEFCNIGYWKAKREARQYWYHKFMETYFYEGMMYDAKLKLWIPNPKYHSHTNDKNKI